MLYPIYSSEKNTPSNSKWKNNITLRLLYKILFLKLYKPRSPFTSPWLHKIDYAVQVLNLSKPDSTGFAAARPIEGLEEGLRQGWLQERAQGTQLVRGIRQEQGSPQGLQDNRRGRQGNRQGQGSLQGSQPRQRQEHQSGQ